MDALSAALPPSRASVAQSAAVSAGASMNASGSISSSTSKQIKTSAKLSLREDGGLYKQLSALVDDGT